MQVFSSGPCRLWIAFPSAITSRTDVSQNPNFSEVIPDAAPLAAGSSFANGKPVPFCTCERSPRLREITDYEPILTDRGGPRRPTEMMYVGADALVGGVATRWREPVARALAETPRYLANGLRGDGTSDVGTLMALEGRTVTVFLESLYGFGPTAKASMTGGAMGPGLRFRSCIWLSPTETELGSGRRALSFMFLAIRFHNDEVPGPMIYADEDLQQLNGLDWEITP